MKRHLAVVSALLVVFLVGNAVARISSSDKTKLRRWLTSYMNPFGKEEDRQDALASLRDFFQDRKKGKILADVEGLREILRVSGERERPKKTGTLVEREPEVREFKFKCAVSIPKSYKGTENDDAYPLILCLPPKGVSSKDYIEKYWADEKIRDEYLIVALDYSYDDIEKVTRKEVRDEETDQLRWEEVKEKVPFTWNADTLDHFWPPLAILMIHEYKVDPDRVILDGAGLGSSGALLAAASTTWRFAGVIVRGGVLDSPLASNLKHLPVLVMPYDGGGEAAAKTVEDLKAVLGDGISVGTDDLAGWLGGAVRKRYPLPSTWTSTTKAFQFGYWSFITRTFDSTKPSVMTVTSDRKANEIRITSTNVAEFTLYLNDLLVDLEKPFDIYVNDKKVQEERYELDPPRRIDLLLAHALIGSSEGKEPRDAGCVFPNEIVEIKVEQPKEEKVEDGGDKDGEGEKEAPSDEPKEGTGDSGEGEKEE